MKKKNKIFPLLLLHTFIKTCRCCRDNRRNICRAYMSACLRVCGRFCGLPATGSPSNRAACRQTKRADCAGSAGSADSADIRAAFPTFRADASATLPGVIGCCIRGVCQLASGDRPRYLCIEASKHKNMHTASCWSHSKAVMAFQICTEYRRSIYTEDVLDAKIKRPGH